MKKIALFLLLLFVMGSVSFAQHNKKEVIYLKNGSVIKGQLVQVDDDKVVVHSARNTWVFNQTEIDTVTSKWLPTGIDDVSKNYYFKTTAGVLIGSSDNIKSAPFSIDASFNYKLCSNIYAGLGAGIDFMQESYMPVFLNLEYHFRNTGFTPFVGLQAGYMVSLDGDVQTQGVYYYDYMPWSSSIYPYNPQKLESKGGLMFNPSFGFINHINNNLAWTLALGYRFHRLQYDGEDEYSLERNYNRLSVRLGIIFN